MAYCIRCGNKVEDGSRFCPKCGAEIPDQTEQKAENCRQSGTQDYTYEQDYGRQPDNGQIVYKDNTYEQSQEEYFPQEEVQKNKGMGVLSYLGILDIAGFALLIIAIMGIVSACKGTKKELPLVGNIKILK